MMWRHERKTIPFVVILFLCVSLVHPLSTISPPLREQAKKVVVSGDWADAKAKLRKPECCVVTISNLDDHLEVLQNHFVNSGPADLDLRAKINLKSSTRQDCLQIRRSVIDIPGDDYEENCILVNDPCTDALEELARGIGSLADGPLEGVCEDVFMRIVCASNYKAIDPMYHTDKAPLRGYVTLCGVGTEFMTRTCSPIEYVMLRGFGEGKLGQSVRQAEELEFIVMKGDHYIANDIESVNSNAAHLITKLWKRAIACVHRSPPAAASGGRRVIISLDLADGDDDREWYQADTKREWRSGMTQRKSRLVA